MLQTPESHGRARRMPPAGQAGVSSLPASRRAGGASRWNAGVTFKGKHGVLAMTRSVRSGKNFKKKEHTASRARFGKPIGGRNTGRKRFEDVFPSLQFGYGLVGKVRRLTCRLIALKHPRNLSDGLAVLRRSGNACCRYFVARKNARRPFRVMRKDGNIPANASRKASRNSSCRKASV